jgi:hypothetical protein
MARYVPPQQGKFSQIIDVLVVLLLTLGALYIPFKLELAGAGKETAATGTATWEQLKQDPVAVERWQALGYAEPGDAADKASAHYLVTARFDYSFDWLALLAMVALVVGYFTMIVRFSEKEYREVINEKFGEKP